MHQTKYGDQMSSLRLTSASIIQDLVSYVVNASDLRAITDGNELCKFTLLFLLQHWLMLYRDYRRLDT